MREAAKGPDSARELYDAVVDDMMRFPDQEPPVVLSDALINQMRSRVEVK